MKPFTIRKAVAPGQARAQAAATDASAEATSKYGTAPNGDNKEKY